MEDTKKEVIATKLVGANVPEEYYWMLHTMRMKRRESAAEAIINAICLYCDEEIEKEEV